eukprot:GHVN01047811.1.p2 GENE.GHVN01047811.1~~GHVN01047811.1.p2  ORF type:complete len:121 (-),score=38.94 GHVN01047811.1:1752-2114(-)
MVPTATNPTSSLSPLPDGPFTTSSLAAVAEPGVEGSSTDPSVSGVSFNISDEACEEEVRQHSIAFLEEPLPCLTSLPFTSLTTDGPDHLFHLLDVFGFAVVTNVLSPTEVTHAKRFGERI